MLERVCIRLKFVSSLDVRRETLAFGPSDSHRPHEVRGIDVTTSVKSGMPLPLTQKQTRQATRWLMHHFGVELRAAVVGTPFPVEVLCGIACKETASIWLPFVAKGLSPADVLGRCIGDASGDFPGTSRSAFPRNTEAFRAEYDAAFAGMLIDEANASRALRDMGPRDWVYKGYGLFQYDLQHVRRDESFFRERKWYDLRVILDRVMAELSRKFRATGELWAAVQAYNGSGPRAEEYREHVKILSGWAADEIKTMADEGLVAVNGATRGRRRNVMAKSRRTTGSAKKAQRGAGVSKAKKRGVKGLSLHIGLNSVDPRHYAGWSGDLVACEFDAEDMAAIARANELTPTVLLTRKATRKNVLAEVRAAAKALRKGDLFFVTYSGHGGQIPDVSADEDDKKDETWCLYDGELIDDEVYNELGRFAAGVRVLVLSDSCHSGTVVRARVPETTGSGRSKMMPPPVAMRTYLQNQKFYDRLQLQVASEARRTRTDPDAALGQLHASASGRLTRLAGKTKAAVILISGCQDNQTSLDGDQNGAFTEQLLRVWDEGRFDPDGGDYVRFHATIKAGLPATQTPNLFTLGAVSEFLKQRPFSV